jgi:ABC-type dipeptide/oligopeptide/nickel transport system ATPase subunit
MNNLIEVKNVSYSVETNEAKNNILNNVSFKLERNKVLGIAGESGSGKTTLAKILCGIIQPDEGEINFFFKDRKRIPSSVQILFQNTGEIINPLRETGIMLKEAISKRTKTGGEAELNKILDSVKISRDLLNRKGYELSGGEQQRIALARILAVKPELLILDEPFSAQDYESQENFLNLFLDLKKNLNVTMICIAHNLTLLRKLANEIIILFNGEIVEMNKAEVIFSNPKHTYTKFLLEAAQYKLTPQDFDHLKER